MSGTATSTQDEYISPIDSFQMPQVMTDYIMTYLTGDEFKILTYITRFATGFPQQSSISVSGITEGVHSKNGCGVPTDRATRALSCLSMYGLIDQVSDGEFSVKWDANIDWDGLNDRYESELI